jgi:hypothetical protein
MRVMRGARMAGVFMGEWGLPGAGALQARP